MTDSRPSHNRKFPDLACYDGSTGVTTLQSRLLSASAPALMIVLVPLVGGCFVFLSEDDLQRGIADGGGGTADATERDGAAQACDQNLLPYGDFESPVLPDVRIRGAEPVFESGIDQGDALKLCYGGQETGYAYFDVRFEIEVLNPEVKDYLFRWVARSQPETIYDLKTFEQPADVSMDGLVTLGDEAQPYEHHFSLTQADTNVLQIVIRSPDDESDGVCLWLDSLCLVTE